MTLEKALCSQEDPCLDKSVQLISDYRNHLAAGGRPPPPPPAANSNGCDPKAINTTAAAADGGESTTMVGSPSSIDDLIDGKQQEDNRNKILSPLPSNSSDKSLTDMIESQKIDDSESTKSIDRSSSPPSSSSSSSPDETPVPVRFDIDRSNLPEPDVEITYSELESTTKKVSSKKKKATSNSSSKHSNSNSNADSEQARYSSVTIFQYLNSKEKIPYTEMMMIFQTGTAESDVESEIPILRGSGPSIVCVHCWSGRPTADQLSCRPQNSPQNGPTTQ